MDFLTKQTHQTNSYKIYKLLIFMKEVLAVPKIKQLPGGYCGVASLEMILAYHGLEIPQLELAEYFDEPDTIKEQGIWRQEIATAARKLGFLADSYYNMDLEKVIELINQGLPVIARVKSRKRKGLAHFICVKGYDTNESVIYYNDPGDLRRSKYSYEQFEKIWWLKEGNRTKNYGIVVRQR
jgi:ABC-type bacteriocin/lantibiotic exporter with double-glycine peptidase domain